MKIAYLASQYPAVSHTFILREVMALRQQRIEIVTFSVRRPAAHEILGAQAAAEAAHTRHVMPPPLAAWCRSLAWLITSHPVPALRTLGFAVGRRGLGLRQRLRWFFYFLESVLLARWIVADGCQHLHCHFGNGGASTGMLAARLAKVSFSMTCHGSELLDPARHHLAEKVAQAAFVACVSQHGRAQLMLACPPPLWPKLHVVRCGIATAPEAPATQGPRARTVLCVARLSPEKGHLILLDAVALLRAQGYPLQCRLVGDGPLRPAIESRIAALDLSACLELMGAQPLEQVLPMYRQAGVTVLASFSEGVPVVLMEAMAAGCPVVASRVGGVPELVHDAATGHLVPPGDPQALAQAIRYVLDHPERAEAMTRAARRLVQQEFHLEQSVAIRIELYRQAIGAQDTRQPIASREEPCRQIPTAGRSLLSRPYATRPPTWSRRSPRWSARPSGRPPG